MDFERCRKSLKEQVIKEYGKLVDDLEELLSMVIQQEHNAQDYPDAAATWELAAPEVSYLKSSNLNDSRNSAQKLFQTAFTPSEMEI